MVTDNFFSGVNVEIKIDEWLHEAAIHIVFLRRCLFDTSKKIADVNVCSMLTILANFQKVNRYFLFAYMFIQIP